MTSAIIFSISLVAAGQFAFYYWRTMISRVAERSVSDRLWAAVRAASGGNNSHSFRTILTLLQVAPHLRDSRSDFVAIRTYYALIEALGCYVPWTDSWLENEMGTCARYVAVVLDQRLERSGACAE
jgi:hypothetical protein